MMNNSYYGQPTGPPQYQQQNQNFSSSWSYETPGQNAWGSGSNYYSQPPMRPPVPFANQSVQQLSQSSQYIRPSLLPPPPPRYAGGQHNGPQFQQGGSRNNYNPGNWGQGGNFGPNQQRNRNINPEQKQSRKRNNQGPPQAPGPNYNPWEQSWNQNRFQVDYSDVNDYYGGNDNSFSRNNKRQKNAAELKKRKIWQRRLKHQRAKVEKKERVAKQELPENNKFFCDTCDRGFATDETFKTHTANHEKCWFENCVYEAAPKLVQLHVKMQHTTGLAKKIWSVETQEDIEKWKAERKKNFPTAENIEKRKLLIEEKKARGEVIETKYFGKMKGKKFNQHDDTPYERSLSRKQRKRQRWRKNLENALEDFRSHKDNTIPQTSKEAQKSTDDMPQSKEQEFALTPQDKPYITVEIKKALKKRDELKKKATKSNDPEVWHQFRIARNVATKMILDAKEKMGLDTRRSIRKKMKNSEGVSESSATESKEGETKNEEQANQTATMSEENGTNSGEKECSTIGMEEGETKNGDLTNQKATESEGRETNSGRQECSTTWTENEIGEKTENVTSTDGEEMTKEKCTERMEEEISALVSQEPTIKHGNPNQNRHRGNTKHKRIFKRPPSLLEKLLANDIRHERNVILQCAYHIAKNNFFGIGQQVSNDSVGQSSCDMSSSNEKNSDTECDISLSNETIGQPSGDTISSNENANETSCDNNGEHSTSDADTSMDSCVQSTNDIITID